MILLCYKSFKYAIIFLVKNNTIMFNFSWLITMGRALGRAITGLFEPSSPSQVWELVWGELKARPLTTDSLVGFGFEGEHPIRSTL